MSESKYYQLYNHFKDLILSGSLEQNSKMPSIRLCAENFDISRTTVEVAYEMLAAEGYIYARPQSGFYVCSISKSSVTSLPTPETKNIRFDMISSAADKAGFNFALWRRYVKSALRQDERLLSYGEVQGEEDLRVSISAHINKQRGLICSPNQIVIGAGTQNLIGMLCALTPSRKTVGFIGTDFEQGKAVFSDYGKKIIGQAHIEDYQAEFEEKNPSILYTSPSHTDSWGNVMTLAQRRKILEYEKTHDCLIIEDDYDSEFRYSAKSTPPLQSMNGGENVVYIGTFSKLLIPSIRISFMVLPPVLLEAYNKRKNLYNQTASKAEQIALCQYIRDGHLASQIRKQKKQYSAKAELMCNMAEEKFPGRIKLEECEAGYLLRMTLSTEKSAAEICNLAKEQGVLMKPVSDESRKANILLSIAGFDMKDFDEFFKIILTVM